MPPTLHIHGTVGPIGIGVQGGKARRNWEHPQVLEHPDTHPQKDEEGSVAPSTLHPAHAQRGQQALILTALHALTDWEGARRSEHHFCGTCNSVQSQQTVPHKPPHRGIQLFTRSSSSL